MSVTGIIGAMELEVETLKKHMKVTQTTKVASMDFVEGTLEGAASPVVVVRSGVGKVNAGVCVQILNDVFHVTQIINTGVAGSLDANINIGDIVVSEDAVYHDVDATIFGYQPGEVPQLGRLAFTADKRLISAAVCACKKAAPEIDVFEGRVLSGDQFISDHDRKVKMTQLFHGDCVEMEGCAIAHAATLNNIPFVIIRAISDKADNSAEMDYPVFEKAAAQHCAHIVMEMLREL